MSKKAKFHFALLSYKTSSSIHCIFSAIHAHSSW